MENKYGEKEGKRGLVPIIGPSSSGKSSVLSELSMRGYNTYNETAKQVIAERQDLFNEGKYEEIQKIIYGRQKNLEDSLLNQSNGVNFIERSMIGVFAFSSFYLGYVPEEFNKDQDFSSRYLKVFNLKDLSDFNKTTTRVESSKEEAECVQKNVLDWYKHYGLKPIDVPIFSNSPEESIKKRADFILENLGLPYWNE